MSSLTVKAVTRRKSRTAAVLRFGEVSASGQSRISNSKTPETRLLDQVSQFLMPGEINHKRRVTMSKIRKGLSVLLCFLVISLEVSVIADVLSRHAVADAEVSRFIFEWTKNLAPRHRLRAFKHKESVVHWSLEYDVDPLLVARIISMESSWRQHVQGKLGEVGLMQVHNSKMRKKYNVEDPHENIRAGCELLRECIDKCDTLKAAIGCYGAGPCTEDGEWLARRWRKYQRDVKRFRQINPTSTQNNRL